MFIIAPNTILWCVMLAVEKAMHVDKVYLGELCNVLLIML